MIYILSVFFSFLMLYYTSTILQWSSYKPLRAILHFNKKRWHFYYLIVPFLLYVITCDINHKLALALSIVYLLALFLWAKALDKRLVFTNRIKRLFFFNLLSSIPLSYLHYEYKLDPHTLDILLLAFILSFVCEYFISKNYYKKAYNKLSNMKDCKVILITASYGKTSIKHFLAQILNNEFKTHFAKGSINTLQGLVMDINNNLSDDTKLLIVEAGARKSGDILEITKLTRPHYVIIGQIGTAHLEYFKSIECTRATKLEALQSDRLEVAITHSSTKQEISYDDALNNVVASLDGLEFDYENEHYKCDLLGSFNASNLSACIVLAKKLGLSYEQIYTKISNIKSAEHRLQIISKEPKFIIDDGFNGNYDGMSDSYRLVKEYKKGKRVLITPGIVEVTDELNIKLCRVINECFDLVIITAELNTNIFKEHLKIETIILDNKSKLIETLAEKTSQNDLVLFSNDAPNFM